MSLLEFLDPAVPEPSLLNAQSCLPLPLANLPGAIPGFSPAHGSFSAWPNLPGIFQSQSEPGMQCPLPSSSPGTPFFSPSSLHSPGAGAAAVVRCLHSTKIPLLGDQKCGGPSSWVFHASWLILMHLSQTCPKCPTAQKIAI